MLRLITLLIGFFGMTMLAYASGLDDISANLQSDGFTCDATKTFQNCVLAGRFQVVGRLSFTFLLWA
jgi:hypothetical protein